MTESSASGRPRRRMEMIEVIEDVLVVQVEAANGWDY